MAKIVEFIGSPGVGKTTLYKEIERCWSNDRPWMPCERFYPQREIPENLLSTLVGIFRKVKNKKTAYNFPLMQEAGHRFVKLYPHYIDFVWNNISCMQKKNLNATDLRFQKVTYLNKLIQKIQTLRESESKKIAIVDEGLLHIIPSISYPMETLGKEKEEIENLLRIMPLPDAVVSIETDVEENLRRLSQRKKVIPMHKSLMQDQLVDITSKDHERRAIINTVLQATNIPFLDVDSSEQVSTNVSKILRFVESL